MYLWMPLFWSSRSGGAGNLFLELNSPPVTIDEMQRAKELLRYIKIRCDESEERGCFAYRALSHFI